MKVRLQFEYPGLPPLIVEAKGKAGDVEIFVTRIRGLCRRLGLEKT